MCEAFARRCVSEVGDGGTRVVGTIAFDTAGATGSNHVWVIEDNGMGPAQDLTVGSSATNSKPTWSPDGTRVAFVRHLPNAPDAHIWVMNADGTNQQQLTSGPGIHDDPAWSPVLLAPLSVLVLVPASKPVLSVLKMVSGFVGAVGKPLIGTKVTKIAYMRLTAVGYTISIINPDGTNQHDLVGFPASTDNGREPAWSPVGTKFAFTHMYLIPTAQTDRVAVMKTNGQGVTDVPSGTPLPKPPSDANPAWSPDGSTIAFESDRSG